MLVSPHANALEQSAGHIRRAIEKNTECALFQCIPNQRGRALHAIVMRPGASAPAGLSRMRRNKVRA
jgi:hypothetical protein